MAGSAKSNRPLFDLDLLRAIVMVADCGSFTTAAARLHSTQSTVSQKVRRLEDMVGHKLLERGNREVLATDAGELLLGYARQMLSFNDQMFDALSGAVVAVTVRLGVPEDFATGATTQVLARFNRQYPQVKLEITSGLSRDLLASYDRGELDLVMIKQRRNSREAVACRAEKMAWIDSATHPSFGQDPVPLVAFPPRGLYRDDMIDALEAMGRSWHISFTSSSLGGIQGAVAAGMGISLVPARAVLPGHKVLGRAQGVPGIDTFEVAVFHRPTADATVGALAKVLMRLLETARAPKSAARAS